MALRHLSFLLSPAAAASTPFHMRALPDAILRSLSPLYSSSSSPTSLSSFSTTTTTTTANAPDVTYKELKGILANPPKDLVLVDVREPHEYSAGTIPSAVNVPLRTFQQAIAQTPSPSFAPTDKSNKNFIIFCLGGVRSEKACGTARDASYVNVRNYRGSWQEWSDMEAQEKAKGA